MRRELTPTSTYKTRYDVTNLHEQNVENIES